MPVTRLNHAVLYVLDVQATRDFYEQVLGFQTLIWMPGRAAFFRAPGSTNDHDLGTFQIGAQAGPSQAGRSSVGLYHLAWEVDTLPADLIDDEVRDRAAKVAVTALDLPYEISRYGAETKGGIGVSIPIGIMPTGAVAPVAASRRRRDDQLTPRA